MSLLLTFALEDLAKYLKYKSPKFVYYLKI